MRPILLIYCLTFLFRLPLMAQEARIWNFENGAGGWKVTDKNCGIVQEPGALQNHVFQIIASKPHHTRLILQDSSKTPNFFVSLRVKVIDWQGAPPAVYVYGRMGKGGFRALSLGTKGGRLFCYYGQDKPSVQIGRVNAKIPAKPEWVYLALACFNDYVFAKAWSPDLPEPHWQAEGSAPGHKSGMVALGVWTSPRISSRAKVLFDDVRFVPLTPAMLKAWGIKLGPRPRLDVKALPKEYGAFQLPQRLGIASKTTAIAFDRETGEITNLVDIKTGQEFISPDIKKSLFRLVLTKPYEGKRVELSSRDFRKVIVRESSSNSLTIKFSDYHAYPITCLVTASLLDDEVHLRISVSNKSGWCVGSVFFPQIPAPATLGEDNSDDCLLIPWSGGAILHRPAVQNISRNAIYPGVAFSQFYALYDATAGVYVAAYDSNGNCKRFQLRCVAKKFVSLTFEHLFAELPDKDVELPYDVVLRTFKGDWRDAANIYKAWAIKQPWCAKRLTERDDVPQFLKDGAGIIITSVNNPVYRERLLGKELEKLPNLMDAYRERTGLKHLIFVPYGWENRGMWAGINYFPTIPSDEIWRKANTALKARGHRTAFLTSGFWWVIKRQKTNNGPAFDDTSDFERRRGMCIENTSGSAWTVDNYNRTKTFGSWRGLSVKLCHGSREARNTLKQLFLNIAGLGVPLISFDQEIGGGQNVPCYSKAHGHPPGYGDWMWTGFRDLCTEILKEGKPIQPELGLFLENVSELAIPYMSTYWSRQFGEVDVGAPGGRGVGLFSYLYHEYVTAIGAACVQGQGAHGARPPARLRCHILANNLTRGLIQGPFMHEVPLEGGDKWRQMVSRAYFAFCQPYAHFPEYLMLGKTRRPIRVECDDVKLWFWRRDAKKGKPIKKGGPPLVKVPLVLPSVTTGSFEAPDGSVATFIVNTTPEPRKATVILPYSKRVIIYRADRTEERHTEVSTPGYRIPLLLEPFGVRVILNERS